MSTVDELAEVIYKANHSGELDPNQQDMESQDAYRAASAVEVWLEAREYDAYMEGRNEYE